MSLGPGSLVGRYEVVEAIGAGGMGQVFVASDPRLGRRVAIKILAPELQQNPVALARFDREAHAIAALNHPNILTIHDRGTYEGLAYIVTEFLDGRTLRDMLRTESLSPELIEQILRDAAEGLAAAHGRGIVHRDLKPENLFITQDGTLKILDFGLATPAVPIDDPDATREALTRGNQILGTPSYMAPEQVRGESATPATDMFAFGSLGYELLTGRPPFRRNTPAETMAAVLKDEPAWEDSGLAGAPASVIDLIRRCLDKEPASRTENASAALTTLQSRVSTPYVPAKRGLSRGRLLTLGLVAAAIVLAVVAPRFLGPAETTATPPTSVSQLSLAILPFETSGDVEAQVVARGLPESLNRRFSKLSMVRVIPPSVASHYGDLTKSPSEIASELGTAYVLSGRLSGSDDAMEVEIELLDAGLGRNILSEKHAVPLALVDLERTLVSQVVAALELPPEDETAAEHGEVDDRAYRLYLQGRYHWSKWNPPGWREAIRQYKAALDISSDFALAYSGLADAYGVLAMAGIVPPKDAMPKALAAARRAIVLDDQLGEAYISLGIATFFYEWDWSEAEVAFRKGLELRPDYPDGLRLYGVALAETGQFDDALDVLDRASALDPFSSGIRSSRYWVMACAGRLEQVEEQVRGELRLDPDSAELWHELAYSLELQGKEDDAVEARLESLARGGATEETLGRQREAATTGGLDALLRLDLDGQLERAKSGYTSANRIASIYARLGDADAAFEWLERAYEDRDNMMAVRIDADFSRLRSDPRFADLLRRLGLDPELT